MECPNCKTEMIWGGDHDDEDTDGRGYIASNLSCLSATPLLLFILLWRKLISAAQSLLYG